MTGVGNLGLRSLPINSFDLHHTQVQKDEILDWPHVHEGEFIQ